MAQPGYKKADPVLGFPIVSQPSYGKPIHTTGHSLYTTIIWKTSVSRLGEILHSISDMILVEQVKKRQNVGIKHVQGHQKPII